MQHKSIDVDSRGNPIMTINTLQYYCQLDGVNLLTPPVNLHLNGKGFIKIASIDKVSKQLEALWLDHNSISEIENLSILTNLKCLYLNNNFITKINNLQNLINLQLLNLSHNKIQQIQHISLLPSLLSLDLSQNFITTSIQQLLKCSSIRKLDLSRNQIQCTQEIFNILSNIKTLHCLYLKSTPLNRGFKHYRKRVIGELAELKFLDDRPVQEQDHRLAEAWMRGGIQAQKQQRAYLTQQKQVLSRKQLQNTSTKVKLEQTKRLENIQSAKKQLTQQLQQLNKQQMLSQQQLNHKQHIINMLQHLNQNQPKSFIASISNDHIKIMNVNSQEEEKKIIDQYFSLEKKQIQQRKNNQLNHNNNSNTNQEEQIVMNDINQILSKEATDQELQSKIKQKWNRKYQPLLQALLERQRFDFSQVQPSLNMIISDINKKMMRVHQRFEVDELRYIWTQIQIRKRKQANQPI